MDAVVEYLDEPGVAPTMSRAAAAVHRELEDGVAPERIG